MSRAEELQRLHRLPPRAVLPGAEAADDQDASVGELRGGVGPAGAEEGAGQGADLPGGGEALCEDLSFDLSWTQAAAVMMDQRS